MWTPPLTPAHGQGNTHSASSSVSGAPTVPSAWKESDESSSAGSKKRDLPAVAEAEEEREGKRRRIAPTPVALNDSLDDVAVASTEENTPTTQTPTQ